MKRLQAIRPVFAPGVDADVPVITHRVHFEWHPGLAPERQRLCIDSLHAAAAGVLPPGHRVMEVSSRSREWAGRCLSAFNLSIRLPGVGTVPLESAYQCAKVFADGGPFPGWLDLPPASLRRRLSGFDSRSLRGFSLLGVEWPLEPPTLFYDWLYAHSVAARPDLLELASRQHAFTDIAFNPKRSLACQAMALARAVFLHRRGLLDAALASPEAFCSLGFPAAESDPHQPELPF